MSTNFAHLANARLFTIITKSALLLSWPGRKQSEAIFPFAHICIIYIIFPKHFTVIRRYIFPAKSDAQHFYIIDYCNFISSVCGRGVACKCMHRSNGYSCVLWLICECEYMICLHDCEIRKDVHTCMNVCVYAYTYGLWIHTYITHTYMCMCVHLCTYIHMYI